MHQENLELYKKLDMIRKENAELQMKVEIQNICWNASFSFLIVKNGTFIEKMKGHKIQTHKKRSPITN